MKKIYLIKKIVFRDKIIFAITGVRNNIYQYWVQFILFILKCQLIKSLFFFLVNNISQKLYI